MKPGGLLSYSVSFPPLLYICLSTWIHSHEFLYLASEANKFSHLEIYVIKFWGIIFIRQMNEPVYKYPFSFLQREKNIVCMALTLCRGTVSSESFAFLRRTVVLTCSDHQMSAVRDLQVC